MFADDAKGQPAPGLVPVEHGWLGPKLIRTVMKKEHRFAEMLIQEAQQAGVRIVASMSMDVMNQAGRAHRRCGGGRCGLISGCCRARRCQPVYLKA